MKNNVVIIPAYNEADNLRELLPKLKGYDADIFVVDDSPNNNTLDLADELGIYCMKRLNKKGLSSAVLDGIKYTEHLNIIVMDADQQHPPEIIPLILEALNRSEVVVASRNVPGGGYVGFSAKRRIISSVANILALPLIPKITDRMTGFFGFRRSVLDGTNLRPSGFKIGLEILTKGKYSTIEEIPYMFLPRKEGESKLKGSVMFDYIKQLISLYLRSTVFKFACVGASGVVVGLGSLYWLTENVGLYYLLSYPISFVLSVTNNYIWNSLWTFRQGSGMLGWMRYAAISALTLVINTALVYALTDWIGLWYMFSAMLGVLSAFLINYTMSRRFVWRS